jgi:creatinine amidohydrolase
MTHCEFRKLSWPEVNEAAGAGKVALIPAGTIEDHGLHLPVDTDVLIAETVCARTAALVPDDIVLLPCISFGYSPHHIDGPGTLTVRWDTFIDYVRQVASSLAYHGFYRILILKSAKEAINGFRQSEWTGHACELETSLYLAADPVHVRMELARPDVNPRMSHHFWSDLVDQPPQGQGTKVFMTDYWSTVSESGTWGDPTTASAEKGEAILKAASTELAEIILELKARPTRGRVPHQLEAVQRRNAALHGAVPRFTI